MGKLKVSRYNFFFEEDGVTFAFNALTGGFATLSPEVTEKMKELMEKKEVSEDSLPKDLLRDLKRGAFLIPEGFNELEFIKYRDKIGRFANNVLELTILPTTKCNFQCIYCYETPGRESMKKETADKVVALVKKASKAIKQLIVTWYGGEPLLELDLMVSMTKRFLEICREEKLSYIANMVTNGYLINKKNMEAIKALNLESLQVTLDGPPEVHDARRPLRGGGPTCETIVEGIKLLGKANIPVAVRVNVDKENEEAVPLLFDYLYNKKKIPRDRVTVYFGHTHSDTPTCAGFAPECVDTKEFSDIELKGYKYAVDYGLPIAKIARVRPTSCGATSPHSLVIDPSGNLYKCWLEIGNPADSVGKLRDDGTVDYNMPVLLKWISWDVFNYPQCRSCKFLPVCMGGCPYRAELFESGDCRPAKYNLRQMLRYHYQYLSKIRKKPLQRQKGGEIK